MCVCFGVSAPRSFYERRFRGARWQRIQMDAEGTGKKKSIGVYRTVWGSKADRSYRSREDVWDHDEQMGFQISRDTSQAVRYDWHNSSSVWIQNQLEPI